MRPLPRFLALGFLLFVANTWLEAGSDAAPPIAPPGTAMSDDELLFREALARGYHESDSIVRMRLARNMRFAGKSDPPGAAAGAERSDAELADEALELGMHRSDLVVRRRLVQKLTLLIHERGRRVPPTDDELRAYLDAHTDRWHRPARATLSQLYFRDEASARTKTASLPALPDPEDPELRRLAQPLPIPLHLPRHSRRELAKLLGPGFASAVDGLTVGSWQGPVPSAYGVHWVYVHERTPAGPVPLDAVRSQLRESLLAERGAAALSDWIAERREAQQLPTPGSRRGHAASGVDG